MRRLRNGGKNETEEIGEDKEAILPEVVEDSPSGTAEDSPLGR